jgi:hypothetical protein
MVIAGMLGFAYVSNRVVASRPRLGPWLPGLGLLASLVAGWWIAGRGGFPPDVLGRLAALAVLTCPVFFSGLVFSSLLERSADIGRALSANLFGAICGGLLEYNAMYFGFRSLYVLAGVLYGLALLTALVTWRRRI